MDEINVSQQDKNVLPEEEPEQTTTPPAPLLSVAQPFPNSKLASTIVSIILIVYSDYTFIGSYLDEFTASEHRARAILAVVFYLVGLYLLTKALMPGKPALDQAPQANRRSFIRVFAAVLLVLNTFVVAFSFFVMMGFSDYLVKFGLSRP